MYLQLVAIASALISCSGAVQYTNFTSLNDGTYNLSWSFDNSSSMFYFKTVVRAVGWVGFGLTKLEVSKDAWQRKSMDQYDVAIGGVKDGKPYLWDSFTNGHRPPPRDVQQDWTFTSGNETGGVTTLEFKRKLDTGDQKDNKVTPGVRYFVWAYHSTVDVVYNFTDGPTQRHTAKGQEKVELIPEPIATHPPDMTRPPEGPTSGTSTVAAISNVLLLFVAIMLLYK